MVSVNSADVPDYTKSVITCQSFVTAVYLIIGCVVYHFTGQYIASPALGSAGILMKKVCYGLAIPGLIVGCVLYTHMPAKYSQSSYPLPLVRPKLIRSLCSDSW